ncbi:DUF1778 domain-containing protein [Lichenicoccus sp.]|uniref:type II toxin-antitoxin system TacA family antitoxin n=1 Tax=Lichenicoccus sp. TaxID=2781899 RepID=UPI003D09E754
MANTARKSVDRLRGERLEARITADQKALIQHAAELEGRSVTDYVVSSVQDAAKRTVEAHDVMVFSAAESRAFVDGLLNPPMVNALLRDSVRRYRAVTGG